MFSFLEASDLNGSWRTRYSSPAATRGRAGEMERTTDTSKRSFTSSQPYSLPYSPQIFSVTAEASLSLQDLDQGRVVSQVWLLCSSLFSLLLLC